jgi:hypothetical protein
LNICGGAAASGRDALKSYDRRFIVIDWKTRSWIRERRRGDGAGTAGGPDIDAYQKVDAARIPPGRFSGTVRFGPKDDQKASNDFYFETFSQLHCLQKESLPTFH